VFLAAQRNAALPFFLPGVVDPVGLFDRGIERAGFGRSSAGQPLKADPLVRSKKAKIPWRLRYDVFERDKHTCQSCGAKRKDGVDLQVDHIKPESKGGKMNMDNLQTLCKECNVGKGNRYSTDLRA
jgi:hypothetical protein